MYKIHQHTKIAEIVKANADSIEAIASLAKPFAKLRNPILRKLMAPRITVAEAASIGACTLSDFQRVLGPLGFTFEDLPDTERNSHPAATRPAWLKELTIDMVDEFDVRPNIAQGDDPLKEILQRYRALPSGKVLCIVNDFIPYPLIRLLEQKGATHHVYAVSANLSYTYFIKETSQEQHPVHKEGKIEILDCDAFAAALSAHPSEQTVILDVRELEMPLPMEEILKALQQLRKNELLHVRHQRIPLHLLEELADQPFAIQPSTYGDRDIRLIFKHSIS